jgi:transducin (beta)-like 1
VHRARARRVARIHADAPQVEQRYHFGRDHGQPYSVRNGALLTLDQGIPAHELAEQANGAVQEPPPKKGVRSKRKAKPNGLVPEPRPAELVNGDAMDIDANGAHHAAPSVNSVRAESEAVPSDADSPTVADIPISTLSIGQSTDVQTERVADVAPNTTFIPNLGHSERVLEHTSWGPPEAPVLLTAGKSLLNIQVIPKDFTNKDTAPAANPVALKFPMNKYTVTALCWISSEDIAVSAREEIANETGEKMMIDKLVKITDAGTDYQVISSTAGLVNTLRWNKQKEMLLSISTDGERGSIKIWKNHNDSIPAWAEFTDTVIFDALWISDSAFVVCGIELFKIYEIDDTLKVHRTLDTSVQWETLKFEPSTGIIAALGVNGGSSVLGYLHPNSPRNLQTHPYPDQFATDLDFRRRAETGGSDQSSPGAPPEPPVLLTTCSMTGPVRVWDASVPFRCLKTLPTIDHKEAFKVAFSPDGVLLAAAGPDAVTIWDVDKRDVPIATCRTREWGSDKWNPGVDGEFSLGWDPDGSRLSVALGNQVRCFEHPPTKNRFQSLELGRLANETDVHRLRLSQ